MTKPAIMTHCISHFPDRKRYHRIVQALVEGGASYIEVQFPFSDPSADGPTIQNACEHAINTGEFSTEDGFLELEALIARHALPVFVMAYANMVIRFGVRAFLKRCKAIGLSGVIVPDLPFDASEELFELAAEHGLHAVPVVTIASPMQRITAYTKCNYLYVSLRTGITGKKTQINAEMLQKLHRIKTSFPKVIAGFGVQTPEQVALLADHVDIIVVGSSLLRIVAKHSDEQWFTPLKQFVSRLSTA